MLRRRPRPEDAGAFAVMDIGNDGFSDRFGSQRLQDSLALLCMLEKNRNGPPTLLSVE